MAVEWCLKADEVISRGGCRQLRVFHLSYMIPVLGSRFHPFFASRVEDCLAKREREQVLI